MRSPVHRVICILAAPAVLALVVFLEFNMYSVIGAHQQAEEPPYTLTSAVSVIFYASAAALLVGFSYLILYRPADSAVSAFLSVFGLYFTVAPLIAGTSLNALAYALPFSYYIVGSHPVGQIVPPFLMCVGIASWLRSFVAFRSA